MASEGRCEYCGARADPRRVHCEVCGAPVVVPFTAPVQPQLDDEPEIPVPVPFAVGPPLNSLPGADASGQSPEERRVEDAALAVARANRDSYTLAMRFAFVMACLVAAIVVAHGTFTVWSVGSIVATVDVIFVLISARSDQAAVIERVRAGRLKDPTWPQRRSPVRRVLRGTALGLGTWSSVNMIQRDRYPLADVVVTALLLWFAGAGPVRSALSGLMDKRP